MQTIDKSSGIEDPLQKLAANLQEIPNSTVNSRGAGAAIQTGARRGSFNVLFLCGDNSTASIIAEALLKRWGANGFRAFSAGVGRAREIDPSAAELLKHYNLWDSALRAKSHSGYLHPDAPQMDFVICLDDAASASVFTRWPGNPEAIRWRITQPIKSGAPAELGYSIKTCFRELETRIKLFVLVYQREVLKRVASAA